MLCVHVLAPVALQHLASSQGAIIIINIIVINYEY